MAVFQKMARTSVARVLRALALPAPLTVSEDVFALDIVALTSFF